MFTFLNVLALLAMIGIAYMGAVHGLYRAGLTLVACVLAGAIAFGFFGPMTNLLPAQEYRGNPTVWYFAADAMTLFAAFSIGFLVLRTATEAFLKTESKIPYWGERIGGLVVGLGTGYLTVGMCLIVIQMLPVAPDFLGYSPFKYVPVAANQAESVQPGATLWLNWDRKTLNFFGYLSSRSLGSEKKGFFNRYGDGYPPLEMRQPGYRGVVDADDLMYYHWYRRWQFIKWSIGQAQGPLRETARELKPGEGIMLEVGKPLQSEGLNLKILRIDRGGVLVDFPAQPVAAQKEYLLVTLRLQAIQWPRKMDSAKFFLKNNFGERLPGEPMIFGPAKTVASRSEVVLLGGVPSKADLRNLRFAFPPSKTEGHYLADGAAFDFTSGQQLECRTFVFVIPQGMSLENLKLFLESATLPAATPGETAPAAKPGGPQPASAAKSGAAPGKPPTGVAPAAVKPPGKGPAATKPASPAKGG